MATFVQLSSLHWLSISSSALTHIHPSAFNPIPPLSHLDLSNNELRYVAPGMLQWPNIRNLHLANNDWHCSCDLRVSNLNPRDDAKCSGPENLAGAPINELSSCSILGGLLIPFLLVLFILLLALVILALACKKSKPVSLKNRAFYNDQLIAALNSHKEYSFDCHSPYTMSSEDSRDSAYESPTSALMPRRPPPSCPPPPRLLTLPRAGPTHVAPPMVPVPNFRNSNDPYLIPKSQVPITRL
ncbi:eLRR (extracellular Leucine-Rich Repeat) ONly [Caenorhabditis elegans]|nr:eLRR (extracellular Leucine-Rich Repeat) ONly [Caenorhabditis elegans]CDX47421.1 eLRR (extracellular Leucine-Rich Repeat) ONly [Caenorhabditis elegans]|eukprot:NP_001293372.1 eLRR (extracellular Leucine-Rich Repeat) ONly [Caenorhabditis elegans]